MSTLVVGVDIAQQTFVAASWQHGSGHLFGTFPNNDAGFAAQRVNLRIRLRR